jgi:arylsulfatase A-like enzyme
VVSLDLLPTLVAAAGGQTDPSWKLDGVNLLPHLIGERTDPPHRELFWTWGSRKAIRMGRYKALSQNQGRTWELYDLQKDLSEEKDLSKEQAKRLQRMVNRFGKWEKNLMPQQWGWNKALGYEDPDFGQPRPYHEPGYFEKAGK